LEGASRDFNLLGTKAADCCEMKRIGLPVPSGFVISTDTCKDYFNQNCTLPAGLEQQLVQHINALETKTKKSFFPSAAWEEPLLLSVRKSTPSATDGIFIVFGISSST
jgi:pyruvate,orthophosphate dikinase